MLTLITFLVSGIMIIILIAAKVWEEKNRKTLFLLRWISKGDVGFREFSQNAAHMYTDLKEKALFTISRQVPLHSKNIANKTLSLIQEKRSKYMGNLKEGRLFGRKNVGISEFLKGIGDMEKDNEIISGSEEESSQNEENKVK